MNHFLANHIFTGLLIISVGVFILWVTCFYIWIEYEDEETSISGNPKEKKGLFLIYLLHILFGIFIFVDGDIPSGKSFGLFTSMLFIILGGWILFYGHNPI